MAFSLKISALLPVQTLKIQKVRESVEREMKDFISTEIVRRLSSHLVIASAEIFPLETNHNVTTRKEYDVGVKTTA